VIGTVLRVGWIGLARDRVALALTFVLPVAFFSIFAYVFGGQGRDAGTRAVRVAVVDEARTEASARLIEALRREKGLRVLPAVEADGEGAVRPEPLDRAAAEALVRGGELPVALVLPRELRLGAFGGAGGRVELLADTSDPVAPQIVVGLLQKVAMTEMPDVLASEGLSQFERYAGTFTPGQREAVDRWIPTLRERGLRRGDGKPRAGERDPSAGEDPDDAAGLIPVRVVDVLGETKRDPAIAFYAAGNAVLFLLFSASAAAGTLLDEKESGTLDRLLSSRLGMGRLLAGKWAFAWLLGIVQVTWMFVWGAAVFRLELASHLAGFALMTVATAAAAAAFGLVLATACRSRAQLAGISTIVILVMSAVGGSMFPRFLMSDGMQRVGLLTFNAWALDGYIKVFWRDAPVGELWPQLAVLLGITAAFLAAARLLARRWETA
jgi:ABC-2 type transport system permease protein